ncbi:hypothetical protein BD410DRAFT_816721 [Rickenella mellea]|uniref:CxC2-like cysteine cluster KDZ transposase-associated domain-containing protein n=1 Tax=Rickenella mellea TaxID=50990 RepID=A0A4Y7PPW7_9AGAM|nr:hypothetical protein BD410DRAFT_816721 [Rickenella mellea]
MSKPVKRRRKNGAQVEFYGGSDSNQSKPADSELRATHIDYHRLADGRLGRKTAHRDLEREELTDDTSTATGSQQHTDAVDALALDGVDSALGLDDLGLDSNENPVPIETHAKPAKVNWLNHRSEYLDELLRHDGCADHPIGQPCRGTGCMNEPLFRCVDCLGGLMYCRECIKKQHQRMPLHRIQRWTGTFYEKTSLCAIGLRVQLGHGGDTCTKPHASRPITVIDTSGIHDVNVDYCECGQSSSGSSPRVQLLRMRWFPATLIRPTTVMTFDALDAFHILTLQSKISFYDFYQALVRRTDGSGVRVTPDRYKKGMFCVRVWRHLHMLKRSGRGHDPGGIKNTKQGECAVECPACPHPGRNLPDGWQQAPENESWMYMLILAVDANFRLKLKDRGIKDPELGSGWAYFVETKKYQEVLDATPDAPVMNECQSNLHAVDHANTRFQKGYVTTGVGSVVCARHSFVRKNGVTDLQKGEKYVNMDYAFLSTLVGIVCVSLLVSYDIACQWSKNFKWRMLAFPEFMQLNLTLLTLFFGIPKFHLPAHGPACHTRYSLNIRRGVGRTDGEGVERGWAHINAVATSTREMGPGSRHSTLDDHWGAWNWQKVIGLGVLLLSKLQEAVRNQAKQRVLFQEFSTTFSTEELAEWNAMIEAWHADPSKPDPYEESAKMTTLADVRLALANEEAGQAASGNLATHHITPSAFLHTGLDLEEQQQSKDADTATSSANLQERRNALRRRIEAWRNIQSVYMPGVVRAGSAPDGTEDDENGNDESNVKVEDFELWLPSRVPELRDTGCLQGLHDMELRLRLAQADDALNQLRHQLRIHSRLRDYKRIQVLPGQRVNTRARNLINRFHQKSLRCAERYRDARSALLALHPNGDWQTRFQQLKPDDIRGPGHGDEDNTVGRQGAYGSGVGDGFHELSWIWIVPRSLGSGNDQRDIDAGLRSEYAKAKARVERWDEEVILLVEEMRWSSWSNLRGQRGDVPHDIALGLDAYAAYQSHMLMWLPDIVSNGLKGDWAQQFISNTDVAVEVTSDNE